MAKKAIVLKNGRQTATFAAVDGGSYRPEWFRLGKRPMLRFKDHEFLNVSALRVTEGQVLEQTRDAVAFGGEVNLAGVRVGWSVRVALPEDGGAGFTVTTTMLPLDEPIELMEGMTAFELPYEYDGTEQNMTVMSQQPVYSFDGQTEVSGSGYMHPFWYYGRKGRAHLTYPTATPVLVNRLSAADGSNVRCTMLIGNWAACSVKDIFAQPTRNLRDNEEITFPDRQLHMKPGLHGMKYLMGAVNWNASLHKDPNMLADAGVALSQEVTVDFADELPGGRWDVPLAAGWERAAKVHFPKDGHVGAWEVARSRGASWVQAAEWLSEQFQKPEGCPGFFNPERGPYVYSPYTRPKWDSGVETFCGQWLGPLSYLGHVWKDQQTLASLPRLEKLFDADKEQNPEHIWTIGPTPFYVSVMRKARLMGIEKRTLRRVQDYVTRRSKFIIDPPEGARRGDGGILAWDAFSNLLAADLFDREGRENAARELLDRVNRKLDERWWSFNCAAEGDFVGAGQGRPFGHGIAMTANVLAWRRFGDAKYLKAAERFGNIMMGLYYSTANVSQSPDLDTRGWAVGANGGRDQLCDLPPWETSHSLQQLAFIIDAGKGREGFYDLLWLFAHTGLCMFPKARTMKRLYTPDFGITYRQIDSVATEREFYLSLPYLAYEEPWDQTMLASYQGAEPVILSLYLGGGLVAAEDDRVLALVPRAAMFDENVAGEFTVHLWNPLEEPIATRLRATIATKRNETWTYSAKPGKRLVPRNPVTDAIKVPPRKVTRLTFRKAGK